MKKSLFILLICITSCTKEEIVKTKYIPQVDTYTDYQLDVLIRLNSKRAEYGAKPVIPEKILTLLATTHAEYMDRIKDINHDYFWSRYIESQSTRFGEVCAYNYQTAASEISAFENSPSHLNCMINTEYKYCGIYKKGDYLCIDLAGYNSVTTSKTIIKMINKNKNITSIEIN